MERNNKNKRGRKSFHQVSGQIDDSFPFSFRFDFQGGSYRGFKGKGIAVHLPLISLSIESSNSKLCRSTTFRKSLPCFHFSVEKVASKFVITCVVNQQIHFTYGLLKFHA